MRKYLFFSSRLSIFSMKARDSLEPHTFPSHFDRKYRPMPTIPRPTAQSHLTFTCCRFQGTNAPTKMICLPSGPSRMPSTGVDTSDDAELAFSRSKAGIGDGCGGCGMATGGVTTLAFLARFFLEKLLPIQGYRRKSCTLSASSHLLCTLRNRGGSIPLERMLIRSWRR
jgi:hypothetical protein